MATIFEGEEKEKIIDEIVDGLSEGITLRDLCRMPGMPAYRTVYAWLAADEEFATRFARAREIGFDTMAEETLAIADDASNDWMERRRKDGSVDEVVNQENIQRSRLRIDTRLKLLSKWSPNKYGDKQTVEVGNKDGEALKVEGNVDTAALVTTLAEAIRAQKAAK